jgi:diketogulonate reductase-like aldo/keto reductase
MTHFIMLLTLESRAKLNNGIEIPRLGIGVYQSPPGEITLRAVRYALKIGYRHIEQHDLIVIPKSTHKEGIMENSQLFNFHLEPEDMKLLNSLNENLYMVFMD